VTEAPFVLLDRVRVETPVGSPPDGIVEALAKLVEPLPAFDRVSVGFPGVVRDGKILTAPNLGHKDWEGFDLARALAKRLSKPARVCNDADMQGLAAIKGKGVELVGTPSGLKGTQHGVLRAASAPCRKTDTWHGRWRHAPTTHRFALGAGASILARTKDR